MQGRKLELVKEATKFMVQQMSATDRLSVVSFDDKACIQCKKETSQL